MYIQYVIIYSRIIMATINIRIDDKLKEQAEDILAELGLNMTGAITIFLKTVVRNKGIPFTIGIPSKETEKAIKEVEDISSGKIKKKKYNNSSNLRKDLKV